MPRFIRLSAATIFALAILGFSPDAVFAEKRVALVIGNSAYQHAGALPNPRNDAADLAAALGKVGFTVIEGRDLDKAGMDRIIRQFSRELGGAHAGLFFYAGHGLQVEGQNYLVPIDANLEDASGLDFEMVRLDLVHKTMERSTKTNLIFLDACRDNPLARNLARALGTRSVGIGKGLAAVESGEGTLISFSTQPGNVAADGTGRNSPYASALLKQLKASKDDLSSMLIAVRNEVMQDTARRQVPWEHSAMTAKFYFTPPAPIVPVEVQVETNFWSIVKNSDNPAVLQTYLDRYPNGRFADVATALINERKQELRAEQAQREGEQRRLEEERRAAEAKRLQAAQESAERAAAESQKAKELALAAEERSKAVRQDSQEARAATEELQKLKAAAGAAETQRLNALKEAKAAQDAVAAAEAQRLAALKDAEQARSALEEARAAQPAAGTPNIAAAARAGPSTRLASLSAENLTSELKKELGRVGCSPGTVDGKWGEKDAAALGRFIQHTKVAIAADRPTPEALDIVSSQRVRICPLECGKGQQAAGDKCVAVPKSGGDGTRSASAPAASGGSFTEALNRKRAACKGGDMGACRELCSGSGGTANACKKLSGGGGGGYGYGGGGGGNLRGFSKEQVRSVR